MPNELETISGNVQLWSKSGIMITAQLSIEEAKEMLLDTDIKVRIVSKQAITFY